MNILTSLCSYSSLSVVGKSSAQLWTAIRTSQISPALQICSRGLFTRSFLPPCTHHIYDGRAGVHGSRTCLFLHLPLKKLSSRWDRSRGWWYQILVVFLLTWSGWKLCPWDSLSRHRHLPAACLSCFQPAVWCGAVVLTSELANALLHPALLTQDLYLGRSIIHALQS